MGSPQIAIFFVLALTCLAAPQLLHLQGTTQRDRTDIVLTLIFLAWVLLFMVSLRSQVMWVAAYLPIGESERLPRLDLTLDLWNAEYLTGYTGSYPMNTR